MNQTKRTKILLQLDIPTTSNGSIYTRESVEAAIDNVNELFGELGQERFQYGIHQGWSLERDPTRIAVRITNLRIENDLLMGEVEPYGPLHEFAEAKLDEGTLAMRALCVCRGTRFDVKRLIAFDLIHSGVPLIEGGG